MTESNVPQLPNIPLEMPNKENLYRKPEYPYEYPVMGGIIRGRDFEKLIKLILQFYMEEDKLRNILDEQFGYHSISSIFPDWNLQELGDFCRHVLQINRDHLGWDLVDILRIELNNITIPGWRLPNFDFIEVFSNVLNQIQKLYFPDRLLNFISEILENNKKEEIQFEEEVKKHLHLWTIKDLWLLLSYLANATKNGDKSDGAKQIINLITNKFEELIDSGALTVKSKICLILLYIDGISGISKYTTMRSKELIDKVWTDIANLDYSQKVSFKYLLGAAYSMVGEQLFKQDTDFVTRKLFIDNFIQNYVLEEYDLGTWFADLLDYDVNELIFDLLIRGYSKTVPLLHSHASELPPSQTKDEVEHRISQFNGVLAEIMLYYLEVPEDLDEFSMVITLKKFREKFIFEKTRVNMVELLYRVASSSIFYNPDFSESKREKMFKVTSFLLRELKDEFRATIFEIDYQLNSNSGDIERLYEQIRHEIEETQSLILSTTFEDQIIQKVASAIEYTENLDSGDELFLEITEISIQFLMRWLQEFSRSKSDFKEALLVFSPLINIQFYQLIRYYYENNFPKKAFLGNLNLHSFMNYFTHKIESFEHLQPDTIRASDKRISDKFKEITERLQVRDILKQRQIKEMIIDTRRQFNDSGLSTTKMTGTLIEDALIHGYLEEIQRLEKFINRDFSKEKQTELEKLLLESGIYQQGDLKSKYRFEKIGSQTSYGEIIPVPLFKNVHKLGIATELFELKSEMDQVEKRNEVIQEKFSKRIDY